MTLAEFSDVFGVLALQLRFTDADEATIRSYYVALKDVELEFIQMAAQRLAKTAAWFPKTGEWCDVAGAIERERLDEQRARLRARVKAGHPPLCKACEDTGWAWDNGLTRVKACDCRKLRRLEILGRRPMPALPEARV